MKPENILLDSDGYVKITDFGLSKEEIQGNTGAYSFCGTPEYLAPEILAKRGHGKAVDWWSLGALIYEMLTGLPPFYTKDREKLFNNIQYGDIAYPEYMSPAVKDLLSGLFQKDPEMRLGSDPNGSENIKTHYWFRDMNWDALISKQIRPPFIPVVAKTNPVGNFEKEFLIQPIVDSGRDAPKIVSSPTYFGFSYNDAKGLEDVVMETRLE